MNEALAKMLLERKKLIKDRNDELKSKLAPYSNQFVIKEDNRIQDMLHMVAIGILMKRGFNEKRDRGAQKERLTISDKRISVCQYQCRTWWYADFLSRHQSNPIAHTGFIEAIREIREIIDAAPPKYSKGYGPYRQEKGENVLKLEITPYDIFFVEEYSNEIKKQTISKLYLHVYDSMIATGGYGSPDIKQCLDDEFIYEQTLKLVDMAREDFEKRKANHEVQIEKIKKIIEKHGLKDYLVLANI